jgi:hypothetical protein
MMAHQLLHPKTYSSSRERNTNQTDVQRDEDFGSSFSPEERGCYSLRGSSRELMGLSIMLLI